MSDDLMVGKSLSLCIRDIAAGEVRLGDVMCLVTGTRAVTKEEWDILIGRYKKHYWHKSPDKCLEILTDLRREGLILQPRVHGLSAPNVGRGHWVTWSDLEEDEDIDPWWVNDALAASLLGAAHRRDEYAPEHDC